MFDHSDGLIDLILGYYDDTTVGPYSSLWTRLRYFSHLLVVPENSFSDFFALGQSDYKDFIFDLIICPGAHPSYFFVRTLPDLDTLTLLAITYKLTTVIISAISFYKGASALHPAFLHLTPVFLVRKTQEATAINLIVFEFTDIVVVLVDLQMAESVFMRRFTLTRVDTSCVINLDHMYAEPFILTIFPPACVALFLVALTRNAVPMR